MKAAACPWDRNAKESEEAYAAFLAYRDLGVSRSIDRVGKSLGKSAGLCERWSSRHGWAERCRAWDNHLQAGRDKVLAAEAAKWERRRQAALEDVYQDAQALRGKAKAMLALPVAEEVVESDGSMTVRAAGRWNFGTAAAMLRTAAEMEAGALGAATPPDERLSDAELEAIAGVWPGGEAAAAG